MEEVVKRYLASLLAGHRFNKTTLAKAMETSRGQLDAALADGRLTVKHINGIATATTGRVSSVLGELHGFAKELESQIVDDAPSTVGEMAQVGKRSYVTPRVRGEKAEPQRTPVPLSRANRRRRQK